MTCKALANPEATVVWYKEGSLLSPSYYNTTTTFVNSTAIETASTIEFSETNSNETASYYCQFSSQVGQLSTPPATFTFSSKLHIYFMNLIS